MSGSSRIYIAGPMTGLPDFNYPAFYAAATRIRWARWEPVNPAEIFGVSTDLPREAYIRADLKALAGCDAVAMLSGWQESRGARLEYLLARELSMPVMDAETLMPLWRAPVAEVRLHETRAVTE
jgi:hypothetical protein